MGQAKARRDVHFSGVLGDHDYDHESDSDDPTVSQTSKQLRSMTISHEATEKRNKELEDLIEARLQSDKTRDNMQRLEQNLEPQKLITLYHDWCQALNKVENFGSPFFSIPGDYAKLPKSTPKKTPYTSLSVLYNLLRHTFEKKKNDWRHGYLPSSHEEPCKELVDAGLAIAQAMIDAAGNHPNPRKGNGRLTTEADDWALYVTSKYLPSLSSSTMI